MNQLTYLKFKVPGSNVRFIDQVSEWSVDTSNGSNPF